MSLSPPTITVKEQYKKDMRRFRQVLAAALLAAAAVFTVNAQTPAGRAAAPASPAATQATGDAKIALINTSAFADEKGGITRFIAAVKRVDAEFQPRRTELQTLRTRYDALVKEINDTKAVADQTALTKKADDADTLKRDIERKAQDAQAAYEKRMRDVLSPLQEDVYRSLETFARARGITVIIDASQVPILYATDSVDITRAFIADYNQRNPATAASATTP